MEHWLTAVDESIWVECPVGITAREWTNPPRTRAQEIPSGTDGVRIILVESDDRHGYEEGTRQKSMERTREQLQKRADRVTAEKLKRPEKIGAPHAACSSGIMATPIVPNRASTISEMIAFPFTSV